MGQKFITYLYKQRAKIVSILQQLQLLSKEDDPPSEQITVTVVQAPGPKRITVR